VPTFGTQDLRLAPRGWTALGAAGALLEYRRNYRAAHWRTLGLSSA
jgi:hypothetical protein